MSAPGRDVKRAERREDVARDDSEAFMEEDDAPAAEEEAIER